MNTFLRTIGVELLKISASKVWYIVSILVIIVQPLLAITEGKAIAAVGLDATPETHPELAVAIGQVDYLGFEGTLQMGLLPMVIFGGFIGASEFKDHSLRTTLLCQSNRSIVFSAKIVPLLIITTLTSTVTSYLTISAEHIGLGKNGLNPILLSKIAWQYIGFAIIYWILLTMLSFGIGLLFRNTLVSFVFLIPQIYNLGNYLAQRWSWAKYLPVAAGNSMIAEPGGPLEHAPLKDGIVLLLWVGIVLLAARYFFIHNDVGGKY